MGPSPGRPPAEGPATPDAPYLFRAIGDRGPREPGCQIFVIQYQFQDFTISTQNAEADCSLDYSVAGHHRDNGADKWKL